MSDPDGSEFHILLLCEAELDAQVVSTLTDRAISEKAPDWIADNLATYRHFTGIAPGTRFTQQRWMLKTAREQGISVRFIGHTKSGPKKRNSAAALKALKIARDLNLRGRPIQAVIYEQDADSAPEDRQAGLAQARSESTASILLVTAEPNPKIEAWILHGFEPQDELERTTLQSLKQELGLDPVSACHRLRGRAKSDLGERDIKKILERLTGGSRDREERCWTQTSLATLRDRDGGTRLTDFLEQIQGPLLQRIESGPA